MRAARGVLALAGVAFFALAACGSDANPELMNIRKTGEGPDEFGIVPPRALTMPENLSDLPTPTPGGGNRTDPNPEADAIAALGGRAGAAGGIPAADGALVAQASRYGVTPGIRQELAARDLEFRRKNDGRLLERVFGTNVYFRAYRDQSLDQYSELERWRRAGAKTPSAPAQSSLDDK